MTQPEQQYPIVLDFENEYGKLSVEPVTEVRPVRGIRGQDYDDAIKFDILTAEQIALITENRRVQISFQTWDANAKAYLLVHASPSTCMVVKIKSLEYVGPAPQEELERLRDPVAEMRLMQDMCPGISHANF